MKHKNTLETHLHRIQQLQKELCQCREDILEELERLDLLHNILAQISAQDKEIDTQPSGGQNDEIAQKDNGNTVNETSQVFEQAQYRLKDLVAFLEASNSELSEIKSTFENEYPLGATQDDVDQEVNEIREKKDQAVRKMSDNLETLRQTVNKKLDTGYGRQDVEDLLFKLNVPDGGRSGRSRQKTRLPMLSQPVATCMASGQKRSSSLSKERLLSKAKQVRAAKEAQPPSSGSNGMTSSGQSISDKGHVENRDDSKTSDNRQDKNDDKLATSSKSTAENQDGSASGSDSKEQQAEIIQVQEVTSSVQENIKGHMHNSFGESLTESSIMTSSTVSALLGDSSLQSAMSSDHSDVKEATGSDSSLDSMTPSVGEEVSEEHNSSSELVAKHQEALLSRPRLSKGSSRYIQIGLPEQAAWEGARYTSRLHRPFYAPYSHGQGVYLPGPHSPRGNVFRRSQSSHSVHRHPWCSLPHGYLPPLHSPRRSQPSYPAHRQDKPGASRVREMDLQNGLIRLEATCPSAVPSSGQVASWPRGQMREGINGRRNGVSSVGSSASSDSPTPENGSEGRSDEDQQDEVDVCSMDAKTAEKGLVTVKLVTSEHVQKHRGPGLLDHRTPADCFKYPREKSLEELADFVHKRLKQSNRGRLRLWLFEDDDEGLFLPRRMLKGHFTKRSVGSLNLGTVTLYVQIAEQRERLHTFDHHKVRFVFVKTPHWDTGEFVVKGHHHVDINKATRAVIQILKKKFMPQCPSSLRLYVETGGKKMYCVPHNAASTFDQDTGGRSRQGDILVLLEDFIGQQTALGQPSYLSQPQLIPLAPVPRYQQSNGRGCEGAVSGSGGDSSLGSDDQDDCAGSVSADSPRAESNGYCLHENGDVLNECERAEAEEAQPQPPSPLDTSEREMNFIIPFDYTSSSTSEGSPVSPSGDVNNGNSAAGSRQNGVASKRQVLQWNLTDNYLSRFSCVKEEEEEESSQPADSPTENGPVERQAHAEDKTEEGAVSVRNGEVQAVEYDSVEVSSSRIEMTSVEYESLVVSSIGDDMLSQDSSSSLLATDTNRAAIHATKVTEVHSSLQLTTDSPLGPAAVVVAASEKECTRVSVTGTEVSGSQNQVLVATIIPEKQKRIVAVSQTDDDKTHSRAAELNPVAPVFTPGTRFRIRQLGKKGGYNKLVKKTLGGVQEPVKMDKGVRGKTVEEKLRNGPKELHSITFSPNTPHGNSVFNSDEDLSVYYTPGPAFLYPDTRPRLQSTAIALADMNNSDSQSHLNPDQISAITNQSSSFMGLRLARPHSVGMEQISAIPNISTSFMEIPFHIHNSSLPGHSTSISQRHSSSSYPHDPSFVAQASPKRPCKSFETSHLQASHSTLPPLPMKSSSRQTVHRRGRSSRPLQGSGRNMKPTSPVVVSIDAEEKRCPSGVPRSEVVVKEEDPAIMDIGKQVMAKAQKSSLNANASEFVPKERPTSRQPHENTEPREIVGGPEASANRARPPANPFQRSSHPLATKYVRYTTANQPGANRTVYPMDRPPSVLSRPPAYPPVSKITSSNLYTALKHQSGALTTFSSKPPILISLTNGSPDDLPPKPRPDTSRHVTFADPPIRNLKIAPRCAEPSTNGYTPRYRGYEHSAAPHSNSVHPSHTESNGASYKQDISVGRKKIGSGRFSDRPPKRYVGEFKNVQRTPTPFQPQTSPQPALNHRKYPSSHPKTHYYNGSPENGYTNGRYGQAYTGPHVTQKNAFRRREEMGVYGNGECPPPRGVYGNGDCPPPRPPFTQRRRMENYRNDFQLYPSSTGNGFPPHAHNGRRPAEDRGYVSRQTCPPDPTQHIPYKPPRSSFRPSQNGGIRGGQRTQSRGGSNGAPQGIDFRFRRPIRVQPLCNTSSDQSDSSVQNYRQSRYRFGRMGYPVPESETETSVGSVTFNSEGSQLTDSVTEQTPKALTAAASPVENRCSGDSSGNRTSQSSASSRQSARLRRGYIQLGLGNCARATIARSD